MWATGLLSNEQGLVKKHDCFSCLPRMYLRLHKWHKSICPEGAPRVEYGRAATYATVKETCPRDWRGVEATESRLTWEVPPAEQLLGGDRMIQGERSRRSEAEERQDPRECPVAGGSSTSVGKVLREGDRRAAPPHDNVPNVGDRYIGGVLME